MSRVRPPALPLAASAAAMPDGAPLLAERFAMMAKASGLALARIDRRVLDLAMAAVAEAEKRMEAQREQIGRAHV